MNIFPLLGLLFFTVCSLNLIAQNRSDDTSAMEESMSLPYERKLQLDDNGSGSSHGDLAHKTTTSFQREGVSLNADEDSYVVAPAFLLTKGVRLGDRATVVAKIFDTTTGSFIYTEQVSCIVGDIESSSDSLGKISLKTARELGFTLDERRDGKEPFATYNDSHQDFIILITYYPSGS